jgi:hypothetical protein
MRPSIPVLQDALERLKLCQEVHALVCTVLQLHKDEMQARFEASITQDFVRGDKNLYLSRQPNRKLHDRQLLTFTFEEQIGKHNSIFKLVVTARLHPVFHVNNLRPCSTTSLRHAILVTTPKGDDDEFEVSHISAVCINSLPGRRGRYLLFMTHFMDDDIPCVKRGRVRV